MKTLQKIFIHGGREYVNAFGHAMPGVHHKALRAMQNCRTEKLGRSHFSCPHCHRRETANCSCSNRHCPTCQAAKGLEWFDRHVQRMLPCNYFMVTFTVPTQMHRVIRSHQRELYSALFTSAWQSMAKLARDPRLLGAHTLGAVGVLHSWTRQVEYHPHIHFLVPAGGLDPDGNWIPSRQDFFLPVRALSKIFRAKMRHTLNSLGLLDQVGPAAWHIDWNVNCENKGNGRRCLEYLSAYLFRVAITESRIVRADEHTVTFRYKKQKSDKYKNCTVTRMEFLRRFLQHVLPTGFVKVRHFGFLSAHSKHDIAYIAECIAEGFLLWPMPLSDTSKRPRGFVCRCGTPMVFAGFSKPVEACCEASMVT
jgi:hypothetical protein